MLSASKSSFHCLRASGLPTLHPMWCNPVRRGPTSSSWFWSCCWNWITVTEPAWRSRTPRQSAPAPSSNTRNPSTRVNHSARWFLSRAEKQICVTLSQSATFPLPPWLCWPGGHHDSGARRRASQAQRLWRLREGTNQQAKTIARRLRVGAGRTQVKHRFGQLWLTGKSMNAQVIRPLPPPRSLSLLVGGAGAGPRASRGPATPSGAGLWSSCCATGRATRPASRRGPMVHQGPWAS